MKSFVRKLRGPTSPDARAVITTPPGEEAQVDYGTGPTIRNPVSGKYRRSRLFVLTLGYSRKCVRLLTFQSTTRTWAELHERAFRKLGGAVKIIVPDNLKEGVFKPDIYDPTLNPLYRDVLAHYGAVAMPCRPADPDREGKVESDVGHAQKTPLKGQRFESMQEPQAYLDQWEERWADTRIHGTTKRQVAAMFAEKASARPLRSRLSLPESDKSQGVWGRLPHFRDAVFPRESYLTNDGESEGQTRAHGGMDRYWRDRRPWCAVHFADRDTAGTCAILRRLSDEVEGDLFGLFYGNCIKRTAHTFDACWMRRASRWRTSKCSPV